MRNLLTLFFLLVMIQITKAQSNDFSFGAFSVRDLEAKYYSLDTSATAIVLNEFGDTYFSEESGTGGIRLVFEYHVRIKLLKNSALKLGSVSVFLHKQNGRQEEVLNFSGSTFNAEGGERRELKINKAAAVLEKGNKLYNIHSFDLPNVRVGSVIEYQYSIMSPFINNFREWRFQSNLPKLRSEYWFKIPHNFRYNISVRGLEKLTRNENELVKGCYNNATSNCTRYKLVMQDIPAFVEDDFIKASSNYLYAVNFELEEIRYPNGKNIKFTKEWKDVDQELDRNEFFGVQIRKGGDIMREHIDVVLGGESDSLKKARKIYDFIKGWYHWNGIYGYVSENGIRKAFDRKEGNIGDINLSLIAALKYAGFDPEALLISTRQHGEIIELHPVLADFNYVIAKLRIGRNDYLLDATDNYPFGMISKNCFNGKGRVFGSKDSYWFDLKPRDKDKSIATIDLKLDSSGIVSGHAQINYSGYAARDIRQELSTINNEKNFITSLYKNIDVLSFTFQNIEDVEKPVIISFDFEADATFSGSDNAILLNPFFNEHTKINPFTSASRTYPIDFGVPIDHMILLSIEYPNSYIIENIPEKIGMVLPEEGGKFVLGVQPQKNKLIMTHAHQIVRTAFSSSEYYSLKELYTKMVQVQNDVLVFKRKQS